MSELEKVRADVLAVYPTVLAELGTELADTRRMLLERSRERLAAGRYLVVVCGEFRRGKSSLLNALVERKALFPVDVDVTTSVVCTLEWAEQDHGLVHFGPTDPEDPASTPPPEHVPLDRIAEFVTEQSNPGNARDVVRAEMRAPFAQLRTGLILVDTPGVGSLNAGHTAATRAFLPRADAIMFVCSAAQPLGTVELDFLADALDQCPIVITAVTMVDKVVAPEPVVAEARARIAKVADVAEDELVVVGVSAHRKRTGMELVDLDLVESSGFPALEAHLWEGLGATCGAAQLRHALDGLGAAVADAEAPLRNELAALRDDGALARIDAELAAEQQKVKELRAGGGKWRRNLAEELEVNSRPMRDRLGVDFDELRDRFKAEVVSEQALSESDAVVSRVSVAMMDAATRADTELADLVAEVAGRYARVTSVSMTASDVESAPPDLRIREIAPHDDVERAGRNRWIEKFRHGWGSGMAVGGASYIATGLASMLIPVAPLILVAAPLVGLVVGWFGGSIHRQEMEQARREREHRQHLRDQVLPKIDSARRQAERDFVDKLRDATRRLTSALDDHLTASAESLGESVARLTANRNRTVAERNKRADVLVERLRGYRAVRDTLDGLRARALGLTARRDGA